MLNSAAGNIGHKNGWCGECNFFSVVHALGMLVSELGTNYGKIEIRMIFAHRSSAFCLAVSRSRISLQV